MKVTADAVIEFPAYALAEAVAADRAWWLIVLASSVTFQACLLLW
jgi:hypothetical protein